MDAKEFIHKTVTENPVVLFMKGTAQFPMCGFSGRAIALLKDAGASNVVTVNVLDDDEIRELSQAMSSLGSVNVAVVADRDHFDVLEELDLLVVEPGVVVPARELDGGVERRERLHKHFALDVAAPGETPPRFPEERQKSAELAGVVLPRFCAERCDEIAVARIALFLQRIMTN